MKAFFADRIINAIAIVERHASSVVHLTFLDCIWNECHLIKMLRFLPNLEELILYGCSNNRYNISSVDDIPNMIKLKTLQLIHTDYDFLKCLRNSQLNAIKTRSFFEEAPVVDYLLRCQRHLTTLSLHFGEAYQIFDEAMPFQLTHLSLYNIKFAEDPKSYSNFLKFLESQTKTLKAFALVPQPKHSIPEFVYEFVLTKFENLKSLRLDVCDLPRNVEFYKQIQANRNINNLIFEDPFRSPGKTLPMVLTPTWFSEFLLRMPNITELTLHNFWDEDSLYTISFYLTELKKLSIDRFDGDEYDGIKFPKLNCLNIKIFCTGEYKFWKQFIEDNSQMKELTIHSLLHNFDKKNNDIVQETTEILKLHTLRIGKDISADECFFDIILKNGSELKILDLPSCCSIQSQSELNDIPGLQFHDDNFNFFSNELNFSYDARWLSEYYD